MSPFGTELPHRDVHTPNDDIFERKDNYYVYLKSFDVADEVVLKRMPFSRKPPLLIPMPPH
jgi:putative ABC transport system ATP-binding protein/macrolide transport system ATP-binding/permease protein/lipoprotein-releasing system ATP-binding protein